MLREIQIHEREAYSILDLVGDLGGVIELFVFSIGCFVGPIAFHSYILKATKFIFLARTKDKDMFVEPKDEYNNKDI